MVPGLCFADKEGKPVNSDEAPNLRLTLHWYGMGMHKAHNNNKNTQKYLFIEQGNTCIERLQYGYHEDFMMVGPHLLSPSSLALVPDTELQVLQASNPYFKGKWLSYNAEEESLEQASQKIIHNMGKPNVKVVEETIEKKLNLMELRQVQAMISQPPPTFQNFYKNEKMDGI